MTIHTLILFTLLLSTVAQLAFVNLNSSLHKGADTRNNYYTDYLCDYIYSEQTKLAFKNLWSSTMSFLFWWSSNMCEVKAFQISS